MTVDLRFSGALGPQPGGAVALVFGASGGTPPPPPVVGALRAAVRSAWRAGAPRPPVRRAGGWVRGVQLRQAHGAAWAVQPAVAGGVAASWGVGAPLAGAARAAWGISQPLAGAARAAWASSLPRASALRAPWQRAAGMQRLAVSDWGTALAAAVRFAGGWQAGVPATARTVASAAAGVPRPTSLVAPWQTGRLVESIGGPWTPTPATPAGPEPCWAPEPGGAVGLLFKEAMPAGGLATLVFACRRAALAVIPIRRVYMVTNVTSLLRVSDGANIPCLGFSLSLDVDSWAWGFSAALPADALPLVEPAAPGEPVELAAWVNGTEFRVIAESLSRERAFGQASVRVQGRGATAALDAPYQPASVFSAGAALTSQQLADQAMPFGWTVDWGLEAWLVPGGIWSHQGTPISAAVAIATAGGGYVQPHASLQQIRVLPRYPVAPWAWAGVTPDLELPAAVTTREAIEWTEKARYNGVYVSGTTAGGVLRLVKRAGSAGDVLAGMVTDPLITAAAAARQRGIPVLADTGRVAQVTLRTPVLAPVGVVLPGLMVRYTDGPTARLGLSRAVSVDVQGATVWQTIRLETHA